MTDKTNWETPAFWLAAAIFLLIPWQIYFKVYQNLDSSLVSVLEALLFFVLLFRRFKTAQPFNWRSSLTLPVTFFWAGMILSLMFAEDFSGAVKYLVKWSSYLVLFYLVLDLNLSSRRIRKLILLLTLSGMIMAALGIAQYFYGKDSLEFIGKTPIFARFIEPNTWEKSFVKAVGKNGKAVSQQLAGVGVRPAVVFADIISFTAFMGLMLPFALSSALAKAEDNKRGFAAIAALLMVVDIYFTQTRSAYLALLAVSLFLIGWRLRSSKKLLGGVAVVLFILLLLGGFKLLEKSRNAASNQPVQRFVAGLTLRDSSAVHRIKCWLRALEVTSRYPYLGIGLANQGTRKDEFNHKEGPPHSNYFLISAETGLLGLIAFFWLLISAGKAAFRLRENRELSVLGQGFIGVLIWLAVQSFFGHYFTNDKFAMLFWFLLGLLASLERRELAKFDVHR